ncbi:hypothetical protein BQ8794_500003 [Mesorhizobium prunaredense]|uniref:Uncharacterized protein n=1 Tax=Mesorhizobium prunaredense TaxID=1631249 RepID=A0A1R3VHA5_9HYPH|nr:hypothetical protein BQ8794_500003 [Mesorhizobium prunaredense]
MTKRAPYGGGRDRDHPFKRLLRFGLRYAWLTALVCHHTAGGTGNLVPGTELAIRYMVGEGVGERAL